MQTGAKSGQPSAANPEENQLHTMPGATPQLAYLGRSPQTPLDFDYLIETVAPASSSSALELLGVGFREAFLDLAGHAFDQVLGFLEAQAGRLADHLDDADLLVAEAFQHDIELGLLGSGGRGAAAAAAGPAIITAPPAAGSMPCTSFK